MVEVCDTFFGHSLSVSVRLYGHGRHGIGSEN